MPDIQQAVVVRDEKGEVKNVYLVLRSGFDVENKPTHINDFIKLRAEAWDRQRLMLSLHEPVRANDLKGLEFLIRETK